MLLVSFDHNSMKLEISHRKKIRRRRRKTHLLKSQWVIIEIKEEIRKHLKTNDNENTTLQNLWDAAKAFLRGKFIVIQALRRRISKNLPPKRPGRRTNETQNQEINIYQRVNK